MAPTSLLARTYYPTTTLCPRCERLLPGAVVGTKDGVFVTRECPEHGRVDGLVCSDLAWWDSLPRFDVAPSRPPSARRPVTEGCPLDCGLCAAHRQLAGTAAIEISNRCNASCPSCIADNQTTFELSPDDVARAVDDLVAAQGRVDVLALSGGEPTVHPEILEILGRLQRPDVGRVNLNSNGRRIAKDDRFLDALARFPNLYVALHHDGPGALALRGIEPEVQELALERLLRWGINAVPLILAARGVNDHALGEMVTGLLRRSEGVRSVMLSMMTYAGSGGAAFPHDPATRLTIPGAIEALERGSGGALRARDFIPLPMPNPMCASIGYFLVDGEGPTGLIPLGELGRVIEAVKNAHFAEAGPGFEALLREAIDRVFSGSVEVPDPARLLARLRRLLLELFPPEGLDPAERRRRAEERVRTVYLFQFMDAWTFDTTRLSKCSCQHLLPGGETVPSCGYYALHRKRDPRFTTTTT